MDNNPTAQEPPNQAKTSPAENQNVGGYEVIDSITVGDKVFALGYCAWERKKYGTWETPRGKPKDYDWPYLTADEKEARDNLTIRANHERRRIAEQGRSTDARNRDEAR